jgi:hypothetical protein
LLNLLLPFSRGVQILLRYFLGLLYEGMKKNRVALSDAEYHAGDAALGEVAAHLQFSIEPRASSIRRRAGEAGMIFVPAVEVGMPKAG